MGGAGMGTGGTDIGEAGASGDGGAGATSGSSGKGSGGASAGAAGKGGGKGGGAGLPDAAGGEGGGGDATGEGGASGAAPVDTCNGVTVGGKSKIPVGPTSGAAKPSGAAGGLTVVNWAGFKGAISFNFDDALASQRAHYDDLNAVGVPVTFYLVGANDGGNAAWTKAAADGHELGNHTMHHCKANGDSCGWGPFTNIDSEIDDDTAHIKSAFGVPGVYTFAAPNGDSNWGTPALARFILNRGVNDVALGVRPTDSASKASDLPCHIAASTETATSTFNPIIDSVRTNGSWRTILAHNIDPAINDYGYQPISYTEIVAAMTYAKGLKDVWADTMMHVGGYWLAQKALSTVQPVTSGSDKVYSWTLPEHFPPGQYLRVTVTGGKVKQCGTELTWDDHGYYEIALDAGSVTISP